MRQVVRDIRRVTSLPAPWILLGAGVFVAVTASVGLMALHSAPSSGAALAAVPLLAGMLGAITVGADFRFGSLTGEVISVGGPVRFCRRTTIAVAQVAAGGGAFTAVAAGLTWYITGLGAPAPLTGLIAVASLVAGCWSVIGAALACVLKGQTGAVGALLAYLLLLEPMLETSLPQAASVLPGRLSANLLSLTVEDGVGRGILELIGTAAAGFLFGSLVMRRRDIAVTAS